MEINNGNLDLEEIAGTLGNNGNDLEGCITSENDGIYVHIIRGEGTKRQRVVSYKRIEQKKLRAMTENKKKKFLELLNHTITYSVKYDQSQLAQLKREKNGLEALKVLNANGYSILGVEVYHMPMPFDTKTPVVATLRHSTEGIQSVAHKLYVIESNPTYKKTATNLGTNQNP